MLEVAERVEATTDHFFVPWVETRRIIESSLLLLRGERGLAVGECGVVWW